LNRTSLSRKLIISRWRWWKTDPVSLAVVDYLVVVLAKMVTVKLNSSGRMDEQCHVGCNENQSATKVASVRA
jgi:hypothetical protein